MPPKASPKPASKPAAKKAPVAAKPAAKAAPAAAKPVATKAPAASGNGVHIKGLGKESVADVKNVFGAAGTVTGVRLRRHKFALVWFDSNASASKAIASFNGKVVNGRHVQVHSAKASAPTDKAAGAVTVFVGPIFKQMTTRNQVRDLFKASGKIVKLNMYRQNYAFVKFDSNAAVQKAIMDVNGAAFRNKTLSVKASIRK